MAVVLWMRSSLSTSRRRLIVSVSSNSSRRMKYWVATMAIRRSQTLADFAQMKTLGANVVRVHLQLGKFMDGPDKANAKALDLLAKLGRLAETTGLYLNLTGLGSYQKKDVPGWYDKLAENDRWDVQARFWEAVAGSPRAA